MTQIRANIRTAVNSAKIRREKRNGRDVIIVPSATLPDNIIMNRIMYPADVIEAGYKTLERTPAPLARTGSTGFARDAERSSLCRGCGETDADAAALTTAAVEFELPLRQRLRAFTHVCQPHARARVFARALTVVGDDEP